MYFRCQKSYCFLAHIRSHYHKCSNAHCTYHIPRSSSLLQRASLNYSFLTSESKGLNHESKPVCTAAALPPETMGPCCVYHLGSAVNTAQGYLLKSFLTQGYPHISSWISCFSFCLFNHSLCRVNNQQNKPNIFIIL